MNLTDTYAETTPDTADAELVSSIERTTAAAAGLRRWAEDRVLESAPGQDLTLERLAHATAVYLAGVAESQRAVLAEAERTGHTPPDLDGTLMPDVAELRAAAEAVIAA